MNLFDILANLLNGQLHRRQLDSTIHFCILFGITSHVASGKLYDTLVKEQADKVS